MNNQDSVNQEQWNDLDNWTLPVGFYFSKKDQRILVPKRNKWMGWTFNLAQPAGAWLFIGAFLLPILALTAVLLLVAFSR